MCLGINKQQHKSHSVVCRMVNRHPCSYHRLCHTQYEEQSTIHKYKDLLQNEGVALFHTPNCEGSTSKWMYCMLCHTKIESFTSKYQHCRKQSKYYPFFHTNIRVFKSMKVLHTLPHSMLRYVEI